MRLTKTDFISAQECHKNVWTKWHKPEIYNSFEMSDFDKSLLEMGNEVEEVARNMFPGGFMVEKRSAGAEELTKKLMAERKPIIFQAVFSTDRYLTASDVLVWNNATGLYDVYEIKMSSTEEEDDDGNQKVNKKKEQQYEYDLSFQVNVAEAAGTKLGKKYLIRLNKKYVRSGDLDYTPGALFIVEDKTDAVDLVREEVAAKMESVYIYLSDEKEPGDHCECFYRGRSSHCTTFAFNNRAKKVPDYSVHDLNRIGSSKALLKDLLDQGILEIGDVPVDDERLQPKKSKDGGMTKPKKLNQVLVHRSQKPMIDMESLADELAGLKFPLYFLDYETYPTSIPPFNGYRPYQHIVFQYSLHILRARGTEPEHCECLIFEGDPSEKIAQSLRENIGDTGTVISWFKTFENSRNRELAQIWPQYKTFFDDVIARTYDLMKIVEDQHYVHPEFYGRSSIKKVLPALIKDPKLSYKSLGVRNGTEAIDAYRRIVTGQLVGEEALQKKKEMLEYCKLDTYAMYVLWKFFDDLVHNKS